MPVSELEYTQREAASIQPVPREAPRDIDIDLIKSNIESLLKSIDSQYCTEFKHGANTIHTKIYTDDIKQMLYSINTIVRDFLRTELCKSVKKSLLYSSIFDIINSVYQIIDIIEDENTTDECNRLNSRLTGFLFKNIENLHNEYRTNK